MFFLKIIGVNGLNQAPKKNVFHFTKWWEFPTVGSWCSSLWHLHWPRWPWSYKCTATQWPGAAARSRKCFVRNRGFWGFGGAEKRGKKTGKYTTLSETNITRKPSQKETHLPTPLFQVLSQSTAVCICCISTWWILRIIHVLPLFNDAIWQMSFFFQTGSETIN